MIASALLSLGSSFALRAVGEIFIAFGVLKEFVLCFRIMFFTTLAFVPSHAAFEAHLETARTTHRRFVPLARLLNVAETAGNRAPLQFWIQVDNNVLVEAQILREDLLRAKLPDVGLRVDLTATVLHARYLEDTPFGNLDL